MSKVGTGRLSGKRKKLSPRSLAAARNPWDGFPDCTTRRQGNGGRKTGSAKGPKTPSRRQKAIPDDHETGRHSSDQKEDARPGPDRLGPHGSSRQAMAAATPA